MNNSTFRAGLFILALIADSVHPASAMPGDLDLSFGGTGLVTTSLNNTGGLCYDVAVQNDGKIVLAGQGRIYFGSVSLQDFAVARFDSNGVLDTTFNGTGFVTTDFGHPFWTDESGFSVAIQTDGKIVVAGSAQTDRSPSYAVAIVRYNANGSLDTTFNGTGRVTNDQGINGVRASARSVALQPDGKIIVAGTVSLGPASYFDIIRYNSNGSVDTSFNGIGTLVLPSFGAGRDFGNSMALQTDGKIIVAGQALSSAAFNPYTFAVCRLNTDGTLDTSFHGTGMVTTVIGNGQGDDIARSVAVQADGKIVVAGSAYTGSKDDFALARYNTDGSLDTSFNGTGKVTTDFGGYEVGRSLVIQSDGKIVVSGGGLTALARYNTDGSLDTGFNGTGKVTSPASSGFTGGYGVALQSDGKILVAGNSSDNGSSFAVARYEGVPEPSSVILMISSGWMFLLQRRRVSAR